MSSASMTPTTDQLKDLLAKVTPGEWCLDGICISGPNYAAGDVCYMGEPAQWSGDAARMIPNWENNATLIAIAPTLAAEVVRLREALADIAWQKKSTEFTTTQGYMDADFEGGYDECVTRARQALDATIAK